MVIMQGEPAGTTESEAPAVEVVGVSKWFGAVQALKDVSVAFLPGEVHALVGENGAGKSTLVKLIAGAYSLDAGQIRRDGAEVAFSGPREAIDAGIAVVYQEPTLLPAMTVEENLLLGHEPRRLGFVSGDESRQRALRYLEVVGGGIDRSASVDRLTIAQRQLLEIARALSLRAKVLLLDEPTSSLSLQEVEHLRTVIARLAAEGVAVVLISHDLREVLRSAKRVSILKDGELTKTCLVADTDLDDILWHMVGRDLGHLFPPRVPPPADAPVAMRVRNLSVPGLVEDVSFELRAGIVTGFIGLIGAGRSEVARALVGIGYGRTGQVELDGREVAIDHPADAVGLGIGIVPEDRQAEGLVLGRSVIDNLVLPQLGRLTRFGFTRRARERAVAGEQVKSLRIKVSSPEDVAQNLSGGNQQKVVLAKWLARGCRVLILDEPTRGIDVGAKAEIYQLVRDLAAQGAAVMLISSEMPEILHLADEIKVMASGRIVAERSNDATDERDVGREERLIRAALNLEREDHRVPQDEPEDGTADGQR